MRLKYIILIILILNFCGCASAPVTVSHPVAPGVPGIYHRVERGQTLWRISKMYDIDLDELAGINHISDATSIEVGQLVFIPRQKKTAPLPVMPSGLEDFIWPVKGRVIASFGQSFDDMVNKGINIRVSGEKDVLASRAGRVVFCSPNFKGYGRTVIIDHGDGLSTVYAKNSQLMVKSGDAVLRGVPIAKIRDTYLHFEIRKGHLPQNPYFYLE
ncbi:MAG: LysM peptidoglycan-binding domain-containing M23 family metallopeptidase [Candidatus Omnitrophica bacterium]|nr:LysM peptidoglycan-binding domain-containing M23 family metallopeptidase [Candidatus Omnitrophota bacterium]